MVYKDLLARLQNIAPRIDWGKGYLEGSFFPVFEGKQEHWIYGMWTSGIIEIQFQHCKPPFNDIGKKKVFRDKLVQLTNVEIPDERLTGRPTISWTKFKTRTAERFLKIYSYGILMKLKSMSKRLMKLIELTLNAMN